MSFDPTSPGLAHPGPIPSVAETGLPINELARAYQPRRIRGAIALTAWNLLLAGLIIFTGAAEVIYYLIKPNPAVAGPFWFTPLYLALAFAGWAVLNLPLELYVGYLEERQFGLAKEGIRAWVKDWCFATAQHGLMFLTGSCLLLVMQKLAGGAWLAPASLLLLGLMLATTWRAADLIPRTLFSFQPATPETLKRLTGVLPAEAGALPPVVIYSYPSLREFAGGIIGLGRWQILLISRSTLENASDLLLKFVLMHDLGHRRFQHNLLSTLAGWAWSVLGLVACDQILAGHAPNLLGSPLYIVHLALWFTLWMAMGQPVLAYLGRRLEYQADRYYLRHGGTWDEMRGALAELARRNLARTERLRRRQTIFHPLPSIANRLWAARIYMRSQMLKRSPSMAQGH